MSETYSVYNKNGTLANELAQCRVIKISSGVYTWDIVGGSAASTSEESIVADDNYSVICAEISGAERAGVPIEWAVNSAKDFYIVAVCGGGIIDGVSDGAFSYDAIKKVLWLECPFENAETWQAYIFRSEKPVNNFAIAEGRARISAIQTQFEKDNRVMRQIIAERFRTLRTPDTIKTLPPKEIRAGKVLAFGEDGNPDLSLAKEDVSGAYAARDEAKELKKDTEALKNETAELKSDAESYKNYAVDAASKAVLAQGKAEEAEEDTQVLKSSVEATVSEFNYTVSAKVQEVESAAQSGITAVNSAKTAAVGEISTIKSEVESAGQSAQSEIQAATEEAKAVIDGWTEQSARLAKAESAISLLQIDKANRGYLQFNKAKLTTATNNATTLPLTFCATYDCDDFPASGRFNFLATHKLLGSTSSGQAGSQSGFSFGFTLSQNYAETILGIALSTPDAVSTVARHGVDIGLRIQPNVDTKAKVTGKHTFIAVVTDEITDGFPNVTLYLDGTPLTSLSRTKQNGGLQSAVLGEGKGSIRVGTTNYSDNPSTSIEPKVSRLKIFNCVLPGTKADDTNGIGYTIEDYNNGVDEPPSLKGGRRVQITSGATTTDTGISFVPSAGTNVSFKQVFLGIDKPIPAGAKIRVKVDGYKVKDVTSTGLIEFRYGTGSSAYSRVDITGGSGDLEFITDRNASLLMPMFNFASTSFDGTTDTIAADIFEVWINGALLSLADYTFNGEVLDASGNGNHATISGNVAGINDTAVETLYQKIAARISNNS